MRQQKTAFGSARLAVTFADLPLEDDHHTLDFAVHRALWSDLTQMYMNCKEPRLETPRDLGAKIRQLQEKRARHVKAIAEIDKVLWQIRHALGDVEPTDADEQLRRRYQKYELTGEESVIEFVRIQINPSTAQVNANWKGQGRPGVVNPILARLIKSGMLRREDDPSVRGSRYRLRH